MCIQTINGVKAFCNFFFKSYIINYIMYIKIDLKITYVYSVSPAI